jgi:hypothetical protein
MSFRQKAFACGLAATLSAALLGGAAFGAKRITHAEAWRLCKVELDNAKIHGGGVSNERYFRGGACMHKYGYRL